MVKEIVTDLQAEREALDQFLTTLTDEMWDLPTPAEGWTVRDSVSHIAQIDDTAISLVRGDNSPLEKAASTGRDANGVGPGRDRPITPGELLSWLRRSGDTLFDELLNCDPKRRIP